MVRLIRFAVVTVLCLSLSSQAFAQVEEQPRLVGPRRHLALIIFGGLGGAVLGLSTLSFYGRPQDYMANIAVGFALGIIGGTIYVTYRAASVPQEFYGTKPQGSLFETQSPMMGPQAQRLPEPFVPKLTYTFSF